MNDVRLGITADFVIIAIVGGLLLLVNIGPGGFSMDEKKKASNQWNNRKRPANRELILDRSIKMSAMSNVAKGKTIKIVVTVYAYIRSLNYYLPSFA